ncbi:MAG: alpha-L-fucosidase [Mangrovibacterium sp.]
MKKTILIFFILNCGVCILQNGNKWEKNRYKQTTITADAHKMEWWEDAKFGMFIHWGNIFCSGREMGVTARILERL